jgi:HD-GYP domain-containing protein (c-di-GMP phosphodiesterase class II)
MDNSKGSLILKALSPAADEAQLTAYLEKRAKSIPPEQIPALLKNLPVILSRNVAEETGLLVIRRLEELGAEALFIPTQDGTNDDKALETPNEPLDLAALMRARRKNSRKSKGLKRSFKQFNKEIWIILSMLGVAWMFNYTLASQYLLLGFYTLPAVISAYLFGRRQAVLTAFASILLVGLVSYYNPGRFEQFNLAGVGGVNQWYHIISWGCILLVTAYTMGTLYERNRNKMRELRQTYRGLLTILRQLIAQDEEEENHCFRVSIYATRIALYMGLEKDEIEDIRSAALMHDLGKLQVSRSILRKAVSLNQDDQSLPSGTISYEPLLRGPLGGVLPMLLGHHEQFESNGDLAPVPMGARILAVADVYDDLTVNSPHRKALPPEEAKETIAAGAGTRFDPEVVKAFITAYNRMEMELPNIML